MMRKLLVLLLLLTFTFGGLTACGADDGDQMMPSEGQTDNDDGDDGDDGDDD